LIDLFIYLLNFNKHITNVYALITKSNFKIYVVQRK